MKKWFLILIFFIALIPLIQAPDLDCDIFQTNDTLHSGYQPVLRMENVTGGFDNAHVQQYNGTTSLYDYNFTLYCNFSSNYTFNTTNTSGQIVFYLSNTTNAHISASSGYSISTYLYSENGTFSCNVRTSCNANEETLLSMSSSTNAHVGNTTSYTNEMCCSFSLPSPVTPTPAPSGGGGGSPPMCPNGTELIGYECIPIELPPEPPVEEPLDEVEEFKDEIQESFRRASEFPIVGDPLKVAGNLVEKTFRLLTDQNIILIILALLVLGLSFNIKKKKCNKVPFWIGVVALLLATSPLWIKYLTVPFIRVAKAIGGLLPFADKALIGSVIIFLVLLVLFFLLNKYLKKKEVVF